MSGPIFIADISHWQAGISIERIVRDGYAAVVCKASEGTSFRDNQFDGWIPRIRAAKAIPGAYHFLRAGDGAAQARLLHARIAHHGGPDGFLAVCDNEKDASKTTTQAFVDTWRRLSDGHPLLMYTGGWWWKPRGWNGAAMTPHLWHSHYVNGSDDGPALYQRVPASWWKPGYGRWATAMLLQFSSKAKVAGQRIDVSAFRGSLDQLRALTHPEGEDMQLSDRVDLRTGGEVTYSNPTTTVEGVLTSTNYYVLQARNRSLAELEAIRAGQAAILAAVQGLDTPAILAAIDQRAAESRQRDADDAARDAQLHDLIQQATSGRLDAAEVVRQIGALLSSTAPTTQ